MKNKALFTTVLLFSMLLSGCGQTSNSQTTAQSVSDKTSENINATAEDYVAALKNIGCPIDKVESFTASTDPNELLGQDNQYISKSDFSDLSLEQDSSELAGGTIEVFSNKTDCDSRYEYLKKFPSFVLNEEIYKADTMILP